MAQTSEYYYKGKNGVTVVHHYSGDSSKYMKSMRRAAAMIVAFTLTARSVGKVTCSRVEGSGQWDMD